MTLFEIVLAGALVWTLVSVAVGLLLGAVVHDADVRERELRRDWR
jgi:hypothetical protein